LAKEAGSITVFIPYHLFNAII